MSTPGYIPPPHCYMTAMRGGSWRGCSLTYGHTEDCVFNADVADPLSPIPILGGNGPLPPAVDEGLLAQVQEYPPLLNAFMSSGYERACAAQVAGALAMGFGDSAHGTEDQIAKRAWDIAEALTREATRRGKGVVVVIPK